MTSDVVYFSIAAIAFLSSIIWIGRTEFWQDEVVDEDFGLYIMSWFLRFLVSIMVGIGWIVALPGSILVFLAWLGWANQQQKRHVKRYGYEDDDFNWKKRFLPERFQKEKEDQH